MPLFKLIYKEIVPFFKQDSIPNEDQAQIRFYLCRFQSISLIVGNVLSLVMFLILLPFIMYSEFKIPILERDSWWVFGIGFILILILFYCSLKLLNFNQEKKFPDYFNTVIYSNIAFLMMAHYGFAFSIQNPLQDYPLLTFILVYITVCVALKTKDRLLFFALNALFLLGFYTLHRYLYKDHFNFHLKSTFLIHGLFLIIGQIFYKTYLETLQNHISQKKNLVEINSQKNVIESIFTQQRKSLEELYKSLDIEHNMEEIIQNPILLSHKINNLILELNLVKERLKISKEKFEDIFQNVSDGIMIRNRQGEITIANSMVDEITGFAVSQHQVKTLESIISDPSKESFLEFEKKLNQEHNAYFNGCLLTNRDQAEVNVEIHSTPIFKDGKFLGSRDIIRKSSPHHDKIAKAFRQYEAQRNEILELNHELRTPLNAIIGFSELLIHEKFTSTNQDLLKLIHQSSLQLKTLIDSIITHQNNEITASDRI